MRDLTIKATNLALYRGGEYLSVDICGRPMLDGNPIPDDIVNGLSKDALLHALQDYETEMKSNLLKFKRERLGYDS